MSFADTHGEVAMAIQGSNADRQPIPAPTARRPAPRVEQVFSPEGQVSGPVDQPEMDPRFQWLLAMGRGRRDDGRGFGTSPVNVGPLNYASEQIFGPPGPTDPYGPITEVQGPTRLPPPGAGLDHPWGRDIETPQQKAARARAIGYGFG